MKEPRILFLDLETSGLHPDGDRILEIGAILVAPDLTELARWARILPPPPIEEMVSTIDMHRASGLLEALPAPEPQEVYDALLLDGERSLLEWLIFEHEVPSGSLEIAGYSIHFDRAFIGAQLPHLDEWLSHRMIDVSSIRQIDRRWREQADEPSSSAAHRVWPDCEQAIAELRRYREELWRPT